MVLISLSPFALKRILLLIAAALILTAARCLASPIFLSVEATPYDHQMARVESALTAPAACSSPVSLAIVDHWMQDLHGIPYCYSMQWKTPAEVANSAVADCKGKAVALYQRLQLKGARNLRLIIGKRTPASERTHTWVEWTTSSGTYVLDPTFNLKALEVSRIPPSFYVPHYAFSRARKYRATELPVTRSA